MSWKTTKKNFPFIYEQGFTTYRWLSPQDERSESGCFEFKSNEKGIRTQNITESMLNLEMYRVGKFDFDNSEGYGTTTFAIPQVPGGSRFGWQHSRKRWVYHTPKKNPAYRAFELNANALNGFVEVAPTPKISTDLGKTRLIEEATVQALESAGKLKQLLSERNINVVTVESLTAGMIAKTLVDIPGKGAVVYGGFAVYDTDAKRKFIGVRTKGVFSHRTASQMAKGALDASRAVVAIAVTGNAMTTPEDVKNMGNVFIGVAVRGQAMVQTVKKEFCNEPEVSKLCDDWKELHTRRDEKGTFRYAPMQMTSLIADYIRLKTVATACEFAVTTIAELAQETLDQIELPAEEWDHTCKPSFILGKHLNSLGDAKECDPYTMTDLLKQRKKRINNKR